MVTICAGQVYLRAERLQIDAWEAAGNPGWNWETLFPYYIKSEMIATVTERLQEAGISIDPSVHGTDGPVNTGWSANITISPYLGILEQAYLDSGVPRTTDPNGGVMRGLATFPRTLFQAPNGSDVRESSATAYYDPASDRPNLDLLAETSVLRIVWAPDPDGEGNVVATGVEISSLQNGTTVGATVNATREVILAGGSYRSPSMLEYSGVGNPKILEPLGIDIKVSLPGVGENLMDHVENVLQFMPGPSANFTGMTSYAGLVNLTDLFGNETDAFAEEIRAALPDYAEFIASQNNGATSASDLLPLLETQYNVLFGSGVTSAIEFLKNRTLTNNTISSELWTMWGFTRGNVHITTPDPPTDPGTRPAIAIRQNYFQQSYDLRVQIAGAKFIRNLYSRPPLLATAENVDGAVVQEMTPGLDRVPLDASEDVWAAWVYDQYRTSYHPVGTTSMRPLEKGGVVSTELKVYGTANVRVVDASVFPYEVNGHTSSTVYAVAERAADIIKESF